jgi:hypothetical protein
MGFNNFLSVFIQLAALALPKVTQAQLLHTNKNA